LAIIIKIGMNKKQLIKNKTNKSNPFWDIFLLAFLIFLYFIPKEIAYPKYKHIDWLIIILLLLVPYLVSKASISSKFNKNYTNYGIGLISFLIVVPTFIVVQNYREKKELAENGKISRCYVIDRKKSKNDWLINCKYYVDNFEYITYYHTDEENKVRIGDTLKITYNKEYPRMYKIEFEIKK
tara:strand:+ start:49902 stop:50447 length:546 start_codon:yes stop_codon:yes gene_type:complete